MVNSAGSSSSEDERDDRIHRLEDDERERMKFVTPYKTPYKDELLRSNQRIPTPLTVTQMTPSPIRSPLMSGFVSPSPGTAPTSITKGSFVDVQHGYLSETAPNSDLYRDFVPARSRRRKTRSSSRRSRLSQSLLLDDTPVVPFGIMERRRSSQSTRNSSFQQQQSLYSSPEISSESSPDASPSRRVVYPKNMSASVMDTLPSSIKARGRISWILLWSFAALIFLSSIGMIYLTQTAAYAEQFYEPTRPDLHASIAGLRGRMTQGHWDDSKPNPLPKKEKKPKDKDNQKHSSDQVTKMKQPSSQSHEKAKPIKSTNKKTEHSHATVKHPKMIFPTMHLPRPISTPKQKFENQDPNMYSTQTSSQKRIVLLDPTVGGSLPHHWKIKLYPADFTDNTQLYPILDSNDERLSHMELREPYSQGECVPMQEWQTTFHPSCNGMHEIALETMGQNNGNDVNLFGTKGFWRNAWKLDFLNWRKKDTVVLKTLKFEHNFEDAHFEHDRIDAVAMERLTASPHVINVFGFCGHSVLTEYADVSRVGELADKSKKKPLARLKIARDIAHGLADVHGIDGDGNATFVHLDVNPANVVSIGGTLKLNDFNIGIIRRWNMTSNQPCGFPAQYPNPQWRSPEEARNEQNLTEKVDVFSMGHIFFRLICGHEPWNKLEPGGRPSKDEVNRKVQRGVLPFIPDEVTKSDNPEVIAIRDAMLACYTFDPVKRPSARDIANLLDKSLKDLSKRVAVG